MRLPQLLGLAGTSIVASAYILVGSRTGAALRRFSLAIAPRFLWECVPRHNPVRL
jgi:hypothetical protein